MIHRHQLKRSLIISMLVGSLLTLTNQFEALLNTANFNLVKALITYVIPFCVSLIASILEKNRVVAEIAANSEPQAPSLIEVSRVLGDIEISSNTVHDTAKNVNTASRNRLDFAREVGQIAEDTKQQTQHAGELTSNAHQSSEQLAASFTKLVCEIDNLVSVTEKSASTCDKLDGITAEFFTGLDHVSAKVDAISSIAEQTNLLALNAAIEAARAGEQGRGFSVVADEVKNLASSSKQYASDITSLMERVSALKQSVIAGIRELTEHMHAATGESDAGNQQARIQSDAIKTALTTLDTEIIALNQLNDEQVDQMEIIHRHIEKIIEDTKAAVEGSAKNIDVGARLVELSQMAQVEIDTLNA